MDQVLLSTGSVTGGASVLSTGLGDGDGLSDFVNWICRWAGIYEVELFMEDQVSSRSGREIGIGWLK